jgi:hypothetical protein
VAVRTRRRTRSPSTSSSSNGDDSLVESPYKSFKKMRSKAY